MRLEVLHVQECPKLLPLLERLSEASDLPITTHVVDNEVDAARFGMAGSPTLLIDGIDPFASPDGGAHGVSCRLYRDVDGQIVQAPTVDQLRDAINSVPR